MLYLIVVECDLSIVWVEERCYSIVKMWFIGTLQLAKHCNPGLSIYR